MFFKGIGLISALIAVLVCTLGQGSLWVGVLAFLGSFVVLSLLVFGFVVFLCKLVDLEKEQVEDDKFYRSVMYLCIESLITLVMARVKAVGLERTPQEGRFLLVCNHLFLADPGVLLHFFKKSQIAFITKKENQQMFVVGKMMHKTLCQPIDRENDRQALKTILKCIQLIKEDKVSIGVFPEGYTSKDGKLHHFRPGVFKIAQKTGVPIVVCTIRGTREIFKNLRKLRFTDVELHLVEVIPPEAIKGKTTVEVSDMVYESMIRDLGEDYRAQD